LQLKHLPKFLRLIF